MRIKIVDNPVRHNVELFLDILRKDNEKESARSRPEQKVFKAWLHKRTGQLFFNEIMDESLVIEGQKEWKPISLKYVYDPSSGALEFLLEESQTGFQGDDLSAGAFKTLLDTMKVFQEISSKLKGPSDLNTKITVLAKMHINAEAAPTDQNILFQTWHYMDRMQAEDLLLDKPIGTYLFRKDPYADILEHQLEDQLGFKLKCFTLTYSKKDRQICDCTVLHANGVWQIYDDDPNLSTKNFSNLQDLLASLKSDLKYPLYH